MVRCTAVDEAVLDAIRRAARPHGARAQPVPPLGRDVGRVGRLRPGRGRLLPNEEHTADDIAAARDEAISYAAYRLLHHRLTAVAARTRCSSSSG